LSQQVQLGFSQSNDEMLIHISVEDAVLSINQLSLEDFILQT
jgi:hypothetical protein